MRAIVLEKFGGLESLVYTDIPKPLPKHGEVVIKVRGSASTMPRCTCVVGMAEAAEVSGIECVGTVDACPGGVPVGAKVAALMGGLANHQRQLRGYTRVRAANVALIESDLPWSQLAALSRRRMRPYSCPTQFRWPTSTGPSLRQPLNRPPHLSPPPRSLSTSPTQ